MTDKEDPIWTRRDYERDTAYHLFSIYRDLGPYRTLEKVRQKVRKTDKECNVPSLSNLSNYSVKWGWVVRAEAYDDFLDLNARTENELAIKEMRRRQAGESAEFQKVAYGLKDELDGEKLRGEPSKKAWVLLTLVNAYGQSVMIEQDARGEPLELDDKDKRREDFVRLFEKAEKE